MKFLRWMFGDGRREKESGSLQNLPPALEVFPDLLSAQVPQNTLLEYDFKPVLITSSISAVVYEAFNPNSAFPYAKISYGEASKTILPGKRDEDWRVEVALSVNHELSKGPYISLGYIGQKENYSHILDFSFNKRDMFVPFTIDWKKRFATWSYGFPTKSFAYIDKTQPKAIVDYLEIDEGTKPIEDFTKLFPYSVRRGKFTIESGIIRNNTLEVVYRDFPNTGQDGLFNVPLIVNPQSIKTALEIYSMF